LIYFTATAGRTVWQNFRFIEHYKLLRGWLLLHPSFPSFPNGYIFPNDRFFLWQWKRLMVFQSVSQQRLYGRSSHHKKKKYDVHPGLCRA
ncbi:MAG TPA: hypothetical protein VGO47_08190, partial [Chlamydiales bacterium]|nr:hypothetical protein [Chlamydiales bacterium]